MIRCTICINYKEELLHGSPEEVNRQNMKGMACGDLSFPVLHIFSPVFS